MDKPTNSSPLLRVDNLSVRYEESGSETLAVDRVCFELFRGETLGIVGESGCGKSSLAQAIARILPDNGRWQADRLEFQGNDLLQLPEVEFDRLRGSSIGFIFQEPLSALDPLYRIGSQISEGLIAQRGLGSGEARRRVIEALREVGLPEPDRCADSYPHQLSGGMLQRALLASALLPGPCLLIADEPTTALDLTTQAQVLKLLGYLRDRQGLSILLVTHDLGVVATLADRLLILYLGTVVEEGPTMRILSNPQHPYTRGLLASQPGPERRGTPLPTIEGTVPSPRDRPPGCPFHPRCPEADSSCRQRSIPAVNMGESHRVWCLRREEQVEP